MIDALQSPKIQNLKSSSNYLFGILHHSLDVISGLMTCNIVNSTLMIR